MTMQNQQARSSSIGGATLLGIVFVTLRLCGVITWPWIWVTAPFWGPWAVLIVIVVLAAICAGLAKAVIAGIDATEKKSKSKPRLAAI